MNLKYRVRTALVVAVSILSANSMALSEVLIDWTVSVPVVGPDGKESTLDAYRSASDCFSWNYVFSDLASAPGVGAQHWVKISPLVGLNDTEKQLLRQRTTGVNVISTYRTVLRPPSLTADQRDRLINEIIPKIEGATPEDRRRLRGDVGLPGQNRGCQYRGNLADQISLSPMVVRRVSINSSDFNDSETGENRIRGGGIKSAFVDYRFNSSDSYLPSRRDGRPTNIMEGFNLAGGVPVIFKADATDPQVEPFLFEELTSYEVLDPNLSLQVLFHALTPRIQAKLEVTGTLSAEFVREVVTTMNDCSNGSSNNWIAFIPIFTSSEHCETRQREVSVLKGDSVQGDFKMEYSSLNRNADEKRISICLDSSCEDKVSVSLGQYAKSVLFWMWAQSKFGDLIDNVQRRILEPTPGRAGRIGARLTGTFEIDERRGFLQAHSVNGFARRMRLSRSRFDSKFDHSWLGCARDQYQSTALLVSSLGIDAPFMPVNASCVDFGEGLEL